jgi:hypothetical protein
MPSLALSPTPLDDAMLPQTDRAETADRIAIMRIQEETTYLIRDYLADSVQIRKMASRPVDESCRVRMCEWCYQVVDFCKFRRETVVIGMTYLDKYLCTLKGSEVLCNRKEYQLAAMTALYVAIKLHEPLEMETSLMAELSRGVYTEMEFVDMEQTILQAVHWRVSGPTALGFVQQFMALLPSTVHPDVGNLIFDYARYQTELAICEHQFVAIRPSVVAFAVVLNAMEGLPCTLLPLKAQGDFIRSIEDSAELLTEDVKITQSKISLLILETMGEDHSELISSYSAAVQEEEEEVEKKPLMLTRHKGLSPVSVVR